MNTYKIYWMQETPGGELGGFFGEEAPLERLPINETLIGRIRANSRPGEDVSVHFPFLSLRDRKTWPSRQLRLPVTGASGLRVMVGDEADHQFASLLGSRDLPAPAPLLFQHEQIWQPADWQEWVVPMLRAHGFRPSMDVYPTQPVHLSWILELPDYLTRGWQVMPHRRDARFLEDLRGVSTSIQMALRNWLPFLYLGSPERYTKPQFAHAYMVYGILPPHPSRRKTQLTFHVLEPHRILRSLYRLGRPLTEVLERALFRMEHAGLEVSDAYQLKDAGCIVRSMYRLPRTFASLLAMESFIVEEFVQFAGIAHELYQSEARPARGLTDPGLALLQTLRGRLSRSYGGQAYPDLVNLILIAATAGLFWREQENPIRVHLRATEQGTGRGFTAYSQFSYAISTPWPHF